MRDMFNYQPTANIRILREDNGQVLFQGHNVITNVVKWLFARMMANVNPNDPEPPYTLGHEVQYPVWGLALGAGSPLWAPETQPQETAAQTYLVSEFLRKPLSKINYVDADYNPIAKLSTLVDFQTVINATTDNITQPIREMGLIGGGNVAQTTDMQQAPYFHGEPSLEVGDDQNTVTLINYKTLPPLNLPQGVNIIFSWVLSF